MEHQTVVITELDRSMVRAVCACCWHGQVFEVGESGQRINAALRQAREEADVHVWDASLPKFHGSATQGVAAPQNAAE
jgi:hypothetical protein